MQRFNAAGARITRGRDAVNRFLDGLISSSATSIRIPDTTISARSPLQTKRQRQCGLTETYGLHVAGPTFPASKAALRSCQLHRAVSVQRRITVKITCNLLAPPPLNQGCRQTNPRPEVVPVPAGPAESAARSGDACPKTDRPDRANG